MLYKIIMTLILASLSSSCVSIEIEEPKLEKASGVIFQQPIGFQKIDQLHVDAAWKNLKNGNAISFLSECGAQVDMSHTKIREGLLDGIHNASLETEKMIEFNQRKALQSLYSGSVDGVDIKMELLILKKNNCTYILTYVGLDKEFALNHESFKNFVKEFKAP